jgi:hypothetical protein
MRIDRRVKCRALVSVAVRFDHTVTRKKDALVGLQVLQSLPHY